MEPQRPVRREAPRSVDLVIVFAIFVIVMGIAVPQILRSRLSANEEAAISTLRSLASAQAQLRASAEIDTDADGTGEYGYFGELSGATPLRISAGGRPAHGVAGQDEIAPAILSSAFGEVAGGVVERQGYRFQIWLPGAMADGRIPGVAEAATGGAEVPLPDPDHGELLYCIYAWPIEREQTGSRCFFTNQEGSLLECPNRGAAPYDGAAKTPGFSEAFTVAGDMGSALRIGTPGGADETVWTPVR